MSDDYRKTSRLMGNIKTLGVASYEKAKREDLLELGERAKEAGDIAAAIECFRQAGKAGDDDGFIAVGISLSRR